MVYRKLHFLAILSLVWLVGTSMALAAETVQVFQAEYVIQADGQVLVTETIDYDFGTADRHGIFRELEKQHLEGASVWYKERFIEIDIQSVTQNGSAVPFTVDDSRSMVTVRIGNPDKYVTGKQEYTLRYTLEGVLSTQGSNPEFYWNVTGSEWSVPLKKVIATVSGASPELLKGEFACYQGRAGAAIECDQATTTAEKRIFQANQLAPGEELTIAVALTESVTPNETERWPTVWLLGIAAVAWFLGLFMWIWRYRTQANPDKPAMAQYEPYKDYLPMYTGVLFDGRLDPQDITAGIIYLAEQGFIKINRTEETTWWVLSTTDYELTLLQPLDKIPTRFLRIVAELLFSEDVSVPHTAKLSALKKHKTKNSKVVLRLQKNLKHDLEEAGFMVQNVTGKEVLRVVLPGALLAIMAWWWNILPLIWVVVGLTIAGLVFLWQPRRSAKGYEALWHTKGFREFLKLTDKERFTFHNAPEKNPQTFMEYLPYAIALGVEKEWAKAFEDITIPSPEWYSDAGQNTFSAMALTNDLGTFSTAFASSSGSSAASGGGSAGGGAGGGGGGSW